MTSYHTTATGSARSVGKRRRVKPYVFADETVVFSKSPFGARRLANQLDEAPKQIAYDLALTALVEGTGTILAALVEDTETTVATITISGLPATVTGTATLTANAGADINGLSAIPITIGMTSAELATAIAAELDDAQDVGTSITLGAAVDGSVVTGTEDGGAAIATLTAAIAAS